MAFKVSLWLGYQSVRLSVIRAQDKVYHKAVIRDTGVNGSNGNNVTWYHERLARAVERVLRPRKKV